MTEVRAKDRIRTFLKAVIEFNNGASKLDCVVKNISPTGARLDITSAIGLPNEFNLKIPHRGEIFRSQLVWREKDAIGVRFLSPTRQSMAPVENPTREPADLEAENARLKLRVRELTRRLEDLGQDPTAMDAN